MGLSPDIAGFTTEVALTVAGLPAGADLHRPLPECIARSPTEKESKIGVAFIAEPIGPEHSRT